MKKSTLLFLVASTLTGVAMAQPTLTSAGIMPVVGNTYTTVTSSYTSPGSAGANQTWNLALTNSGSAASTGVAPSSSPYASSFPSATVAFNSSGNWVFYKGTASAWENDGFANSSGVVLAYTNVEDLLHFPFNYNNSYTDSWAGTFVQSTYTYYRTGTTTVTYDGYGTLTTPDGTFSNVARVHFVQNYQDSTNISSTPFVITYVNDEYMWYLNGNHSVIAAVYTLTPSTSSPVTGGYYMTGVVSGIEDVPGMTSMSLAPNPANEKTDFTFTLAQEKNVTVKLYNSVGQEMENAYSLTGIAGENKISIPVAELPNGIYFANVSLDGTPVASKRFIVAH